jgi:hypothetical protein
MRRRGTSCRRHELIAAAVDGSSLQSRMLLSVGTMKSVVLLYTDGDGV